MSNYSELLKDPRWQKKRLEILERDKFQCRACEQTDKTLHVHHLEYKKGKKPWEYSKWKLITLCEECHELIHTLDKIGVDLGHAEMVGKCISDFDFEHFEDCLKG